MFTTGIYFLYRLFVTAATPLILMYFVARSMRRPRYWATLRERLGTLPRLFTETAAGGVWLHAVSVGEVISIGELVKRLRAEIPETAVFVSVGTLAGRDLAERRLGPLVDGVFYAPLDLVWAIRRTMRRVRPGVVVIAETEIWPNLFREVKRAGAGLIVVNGRVSDDALPRYRRWRWFFRHALVWPDVILAQDARMRERFLEVGAPAAKVLVGGNLKYDFEPGPAPAEVAEFLDRLQPSAVWIAASTMPPDEEDTVIAAFRELAAENAGLLLILAPRKPERFDLAARKLDEAGAPFVRRSSLGAMPVPLSLPGVLLLDSMGELSALFSRADVVFMGGTLAPCGGHNILEPAMFGKAIVVGPHMENFHEIAAAFRAADAMAEIASDGELRESIGKLLRDRGRREDLGRRAKTCSETQRGATSFAVTRIRNLSNDAAPGALPVAAARVGLTLFHWGSGVVRRYQSARRVKLRTPVISVGNLTMGGSGKTPMTLYLAQRLSKPAILTRGYRRQSGRDLILAAGESADWRETGDEAQIFLRSGLAPLGIGSDRAKVGRAIEERFAVEHFILDDGFQHWKLARQTDIVLVDSLDPFPAGRLREPMKALGRAGVFVITRGFGKRPAIEREIRKYNAGAPIFYSRVVAECWIEGASGRRVELRDSALEGAAAFCGLANPASFWTTIAAIGLHPAERIAFPDHTRHDAGKIARLRERYGALLTTEKDWINLGGAAPGGVFWLKFRVEVENEDLFLRTIAQAGVEYIG